MARTDKRAGLAEAVGLIPDGEHLALCGFAISRNAVAFAHDLIWVGRRQLRVSQVVGGLETDLLVAAGLVDQLTYGGGSLDRPRRRQPGRSPWTTGLGLSGYHWPPIPNRPTGP
jgi:acyl CoA:acetate/3-ketoacid CoA transferase alpha subunit